MGMKALDAEEMRGLAAMAARGRDIDPETGTHILAEPIPETPREEEEYEYIDQVVEAAGLAELAIRDYYKEMENRPTLAEFEVNVASHFLNWMSVQYENDSPSFR